MQPSCRFRLAAAIGLALVASTAVAQPFQWSTAANNGVVAPGGDPAAKFRSYNQPAINNAGVVVFRARSSTGSGGGSQVDGVYKIDLSVEDPAVVKLLARNDTVPDPNNTLYTGVLAAFSEFPSTPRIDATSDLIATRGQSQPVWTYILDATETRVGTSGVYAFPGGVAVTGASLLGNAVEADQITLSFPWFAVPGAELGTRFDQFPGAPGVLDNRYIVFKGNYTDPGDGLSRTGVYYRDVVSSNPIAYTGLIANSNMLIPNQPAEGTTRFGSTAPPSAANGYVFFTGLDNEDAPTLGGIYRAHMIVPAPPLAPTIVSPPLEVLVGIGDQVPGEAPDTGFRAFGEGLSVSYDGSRVAFWASWGDATFPKILYCPTDGNPDLIAYCESLYPSGFGVDVPVNQGIFVYDANSGLTTRVARTGEDGIADFVYWGFSGRPPGVGGSTEPGTELARWRSATFTAMSSASEVATQVAFKAQRNATDGIYLREGLSFQLPLRTIAEVGTTPGTSIDPLAPVDSLVSAVGVERDGFRNGFLAITASRLYVDPNDPLTTIGWGGIYVAPVPVDVIFRHGFD